MQRSYSSLGLIAIGLVAVASLDPRLARGSSGGFQIVVSASNSTNEMSREEVASCYLGVRRHWSDGQPVLVLDQSAKSSVRAAFSEQVLGKGVDAVQTHWMKLIMAGRGRPPLTASEDDVLSMVAKDRRMLGYVSAEVALPPSVKVVTIRD